MGEGVRRGKGARRGGAGASPPAHSEASRLRSGEETTGVLPPSAARDARAAAARPSCHPAAATHSAPDHRSERPPGLSPRSVPRSPMAGLWRRTPGREAARVSGRPHLLRVVRPSVPSRAGGGGGAALSVGRADGRPVISPSLVRLPCSFSPAHSPLPPYSTPALSSPGRWRGRRGSGRPQAPAGLESGGWNPPGALNSRAPRCCVSASSWGPGPGGRSGGRGRAGPSGGRARRGGRTVRAGRAGQAAGRAGGGGRAPGSVTPLAAPPQTPQERSLRHPPSCFLVPSQSAERPSASSANQPPRPALAPPANPALGSPSQSPANQNRGSVVPTQGAARGGWGRRCGEWWGLGGGVRCQGWWRVVVFFPGFLYFFLRLHSLSPHPMVTRP